MLPNKSKSSIKKPVVNPFEQITEFGQDTAKKIGEAVIDTFNPFHEIWGSPTPKPETMPGGPNFSPVDFGNLEKKYKEQDNPDIEKIRQQLTGQKAGNQDGSRMPNISAEHTRRHKEYKREEEEYYMQKKQEMTEKERQELMEKQQKDQQEEAEKQAQAQQTVPQGKVRKSILGGGKRKAHVDLPPEVRSERRGGASKH